MSILGLSSSFFGLTIIESPHAVSLELGREHIYRPWMAGRVYHRRIQKKWTRRFGYVEQPCMYVAANKLIAHPIAVALLREQYPPVTRYE